MTVEQTGTTAMDCADLERSLDAYLDGELYDQDRAVASAHLRACAPCRALAEREGQLREGVRRCLRRALQSGESSPVQAPSGLRLRIVGALDAERVGGWRRLLAPVPIGIAAICAALTFFLLFRAREDLLVEETVRRHVRDLPLEVTATAVGPDSVPTWFTGKLDFNPRPPRFAAPEVRLIGARLSHIGDHPAAYMRYELPHGHLGLFIVDDPERRFGESGRAVQVGAREVHLANARGYSVAMWRNEHIVYSLVGDVDEQQLAHVLETATGERP